MIPRRAETCSRSTLSGSPFSFVTSKYSSRTSGAGRQQSHGAASKSRICCSPTLEIPSMARFLSLTPMAATPPLVFAKAINSSARSAGLILADLPSKHSPSGSWVKYWASVRFIAGFPHRPSYLKSFPPVKFQSKCLRCLPIRLDRRRTVLCRLVISSNAPEFRRRFALAERYRCGRALPATPVTTPSGARMRYTEHPLPKNPSRTALRFLRPWGRFFREFSTNCA